MRLTSIGTGSPAFMPMGVALTTTSKPVESLLPVLTFNAG